MKKNYLKILAVAASLLCSCQPDNMLPSTNNTTGKVSKPTISVLTATSTTSDFEVILKIQSDEMPTSVKLHYGNNTSKTSNPIINKTSNCSFKSMAGKNTYYYRSIHTGFNGGNYIYFYGEATNSRGTSITSTRYVIIKR